MCPAQLSLSFAVLILLLLPCNYQLLPSFAIGTKSAEFVPRHIMLLMLSPTLGFAFLLHFDLALAEICGATGAIGDGNLLCMLCLLVDGVGRTPLPPTSLTLLPPDLPNAWNDDGSGFACVAVSLRAQLLHPHPH